MYYSPTTTRFRSVALIFLSMELVMAWLNAGHKNVRLQKHRVLPRISSQQELSLASSPTVLLSSSTIAPSVESSEAGNDDDDDDIQKTDIIGFGWTDEVFQEWVVEELKKEAPELYKEYTAVFIKSSHCITNWRRRFRGNMPVWKRIFKKERVIKEVIESIPIIHAVDQWIHSQSPSHDNVTIIDLCSGKGYLSMILSEYLPQDKVEKCILIDKAWPMCHATPKPHHMNWDHIYGNVTKTVEVYDEATDTMTMKNTTKSYFPTWPIPLHTSKQDLKQKATMRQLKKRYQKTSGPILVLAVHLCGTLSVQAVTMFHQIENVQTMVLKPCCLPGMVYERRQDTFDIPIQATINNGKKLENGNDLDSSSPAPRLRRPFYSFPTKDVCAPGKWQGKKWIGPPRWHLQDRFDTWCYHLHEGMKDNFVDRNDNGEEEEEDDLFTIQTKMLNIQVQNQGGYQNTFLFAEKIPLTNDLWNNLPKESIPSERTPTEIPQTT